MPFQAESGGELVTPLDVTQEDPAECPGCGEGFQLVRAFERKDGATVARHFRHDQRNEECAWESDEHVRMKVIAYSTLSSQLWGADVSLEGAIGRKVADVLVEFSAPRLPWGRGIGVEAQYRNKSKDIERTTVEYLRNGYSVAWLFPEDFDGDTLHFDWNQENSAISTPWPDAVPRRSSLDLELSEVIGSPPGPSPITLPLLRLPNSVLEQLRLSWSFGLLQRDDTDGIPFPISRVLEKAGFSEADDKKGLFYKPVGDGCLFVDFRARKKNFSGGMELAVGLVPYPRLYVRQGKPQSPTFYVQETPKKQVAREVEEAHRILDRLHIPPERIRISGGLAAAVQNGFGTQDTELFEEMVRASQGPGR